MSYTPELAAVICERLAAGEPLRVICRDDGMPHFTTVYDWKAEHEEFALRFARARETGYDAIAEETLDIADDGTNDYMERTDAHGHVQRVFDAEHVQRSKLRVETRLKLLAKWSPKRYGDRLEIDGKLEVDVATRIVAARKRASTGE